MKAIGVKFDDEDKIIYASCDEFDIKKNITVVVEIDDCKKFGVVVTDIIDINENKINGKILRVSTKKDYQDYKNNLKDSIKALVDAKKIAKKYELNMNIMDAYFTLDRDQLLFHFYADERIDFRLLARDLASIYKTRIELRQIGVRDKAKKIGGFGYCGQQLCCARYLNDFESVSISMAKNQNLSLNPNKINGVCGRLLCCLKYENDCYKECKANCPNIGQAVQTEQGYGTVVEVKPLEGKYKVEVKDVGIIEVDNGSN